MNAQEADARALEIFAEVSASSISGSLLRSRFIELEEELDKCSTAMRIKNKLKLQEDVPGKWYDPAWYNEGFPRAALANSMGSVKKVSVGIMKLIRQMYPEVPEAQKPHTEGTFKEHTSDTAESVSQLLGFDLAKYRATLKQHKEAEGKEVTKPSFEYGRIIRLVLAPGSKFTQTGSARASRDITLTEAFDQSVGHNIDMRNASGEITANVEHLMFRELQRVGRSCGEFGPTQVQGRSFDSHGSADNFEAKVQEITYRDTNGGTHDYYFTTPATQAEVSNKIQELESAALAS